MTVLAPPVGSLQQEEASAGVRQERQEALRQLIGIWKTARPPTDEQVEQLWEAVVRPALRTGMNRTGAIRLTHGIDVETRAANRSCTNSGNQYSPIGTSRVPDTASVVSNK